MSAHAPNLTFNAIATLESLKGETLLKPALNLLPLSVVITDANGCIMHANAAAHEMLSRGDLVWCRRGILHTRTPGRAAKLIEAIRTVANCPACFREVALTCEDGCAAIAHIRPMVLAASMSVAAPTNAVAVLITEPRRLRVPPLAALAELFDLTQSELRVLARIASGLNRKAAATALGVADSTVKSHLDNIFLKTGTSDQAGLCRLVDCLSWPR